MLSARAYSFRQMSRLAISLSWVGGYTNVIAWLACGEYISHMTGNTTGFGRALGEWSGDRVCVLGLILVCFLLGAAVSGFMTESADRAGVRSRYILPMAGEVVLLALFAWGINTHPDHAAGDGLWRYWMSGLGAAAMGLQNATITKISGAIVRTTHVTGVLTDIGLEGMQLLLWCRDSLRGRGAERAGRIMRITQRHPAFLRLALLGSIYGSFLFGVIAGTLMFNYWAAFSLAPPVIFLLWIILVDWRKPIAVVEEMDLLNDPELAAHGIVKALLPKGVGIYRFTCAHSDTDQRAPDFEHWVERLPRHWKLIVLALNPRTRFNANAVMGLEAAVGTLRRQGRKLILSGVTPAQFQALDSLGVARIMDTRNLCPDMEFAIARVMAELQETEPPNAAVV